MIKLYYDALAPEQQSRLMTAFEGEFAQYVELPLGHYIGVNTDCIQHLEPTEKAGVWAYGRIKGKMRIQDD